MGTFSNSKDSDEMRHFIRVYTVKVKKLFTIFFENYNLTPLDMFIRPSQVNCIKPEGRVFVCLIRLILACPPGIKRKISTWVKINEI